jgi:soluble lytic murein transglycosylase-like protein
MMYGTGKMMGLDGTSYYDERRDPVKSTQAGVKYLKQLYDLYGDGSWHWRPITRVQDMSIRQ